MTTYCYLVLLLVGSAFPEPGIEDQVLAARRDLQNGHLSIVSRKQVGEETTTFEYEIWFRGPDLRIDEARWKGDSRPDVLPAGAVHRYARTAEGVIRGRAREPAGNEPKLAVRIDHEQSPSFSDARDKPVFFDPRILGMSANSVGVLHAMSLNGLIGRTDRTEFEERSLDGDLSELTFKVREWTDRVTIDRARGPSIVHAEVESLDEGKKWVDRIDCKLARFDDVWFPKTVHYEREYGGEIVESETVTVRHATFNKGVDPVVFTVEGMNFPPGSRLDEHPRNPDGPQIWDGERVVARGAALTAATPPTSGAKWWLIGVCLLAGAVVCFVAYLRLRASPA